MNRKYQLKSSFKEIFQHSRADYADPAILIADLDFEALSQVIRYNMEPLYRFRSDNYCEEACEYRSELLLPVSGTMIYEQMISRECSLVTLERSYELWILDDLRFVLVSKVKIADSTDMFNCEYRSIRTMSIEQIALEVDLDLNALAAALKELIDSFRDCSMPFHEL